MSASSTPRELGFRMPAEWEPHEGTWLAWPHQKEDWPGRFAPIAWVYADVVRRLARRERVRILISDAALETRTRRMLRWLGVDEAAVEFFPAPLDRTWVRDFGPIFVKDSAGEVALTNWRFNGWAKYPNWQRDDAVPDLLAEGLGLRQWQPVVNGHRVVLEGGSIDVNGQGALLTTEECLLSPIQARNPELNREQIEQALCDYLGVRKILWLRNGIAGDDTHGHVDDLSRFVSPNVVVVASEEDRSDVNYEPLLENRRLLESMTDQDGRPLQVVPLPMPEPVIFKGQRLPASYANFYIANGVVLVPTFNDPRDRIALNILSELFADREVTGIYCGDLVWGLGTLHCMTQQQPA
jgi:agmatine deiminase